MFAALLAFLAKIGIGTIATKIADAYQTKQTAATDAERIAADERIKALQARRDVMVAEGGSQVNAFVRASFAIPVAFYYGKIFLWDKALALGSTDPLSDDLQWTARAVIAFYFLYEGITQGARILRR